MTSLAARIIDTLTESPVPLAANEIGHRLGKGVADVMIALYELEQAGTVKQRLRGVRQRPYYELASH